MKLPIQRGDKWIGRLACWPQNADTFLRPYASGHGDKHCECLWRLSTPDFWWWIGRIPAFPCGGSKWISWLLDEGLLSFSAPGTVGCRTREKSLCWPSLWPPWPAGPAGDPGGCSWPRSWCTDGEVKSSKESYAHPILDSVDGSAGAQQTSGSWSSCPSLLALSWVGSAAGSSAGTCTKWLILRYGPLNSRVRRRTQALKHWSPRLVLLGWGSRFHACLVALLGLLDEGHRRARHPICLPDGPNPVLENLRFRTQDMRTLERCRPHLTQDLRLKTKVLEQSVPP